jgi:CheY-like chemotaxis protein/glycine cleavage system H lipoate-binding protein
VFLVADIVIRLLLNKFLEKKKRKQRHDLLDKSLEIDLGREARSLKQVKVDNPKAKILCVDDEAIILDSFRKILVLDGYSVDTVESGKEALSLIHKHHYDFVFTDLKMPEMDGAEVARAVKEMRPDMDVIIITGYATVESAVECMKYGVMDYVQKPFTEDELLEFVERLRAARQEAIKSELKPRVHITQLDTKSNVEFDEFAIPGGLFISTGHCWASVEQDGMIRVGIDDFAKNVIGRIDEIELPNLKMNAKRGEPLFSVRHGNDVIPFNAPVSGSVSRVNAELLKDLDELDVTTYGKNWVCAIDADELDVELGELRIGQAVVSLYQKDIEQLAAIIGNDPGVAEGKQDLLRKSNLSRLQFGELSDGSRREIIARFFQQEKR